MKRVVVAAAVAAVLMTQQSCAASSVPVDMSAGEVATARVWLHSEPDKELQWSGLTDCQVSFTEGRRVILESHADSGRLDLRTHNNAELVIKVVSRRAQQLHPVIEYSYLGMAPGAVTVKKRIHLEK